MKWNYALIQKYPALIDKWWEQVSLDASATVNEMELRTEAEVSCINRKWREQVTVNLDGAAHKKMELRTAWESKVTGTCQP